MKKLQFTKNGLKYFRVSKKTAKKLYLQGVIVNIAPCNLRPGAPWYPEIEIQSAAGDFNTLCNKAIYYLCNGAAGSYLCFYVPEWAFVGGATI